MVIANPTILTINEDGSVHPSGDLVISDTGYSFGDVVVIVTPLSYRQYEADTGLDVDTTFTRRPDAASGQISKL